MLQTGWWASKWVHGGRKGFTKKREITWVSSTLTDTSPVCKSKGNCLTIVVWNVEGQSHIGHIDGNQISFRCKYHKSPRRCSTVWRAAGFGLTSPFCHSTGILLGRAPHSSRYSAPVPACHPSPSTSPNPSRWTSCAPYGWSQICRHTETVRRHTDGHFPFRAVRRRGLTWCRALWAWQDWVRWCSSRKGGSPCRRGCRSPPWQKGTDGSWPSLKTRHSRHQGAEPPAECRGLSTDPDTDFSATLGVNSTPYTQPTHPNHHFVENFFSFGSLYSQLPAVPQDLSVCAWHGKQKY